MIEKLTAFGPDRKSYVSVANDNTALQWTHLLTASFDGHSCRVAAATGAFQEI